MTRSCKKLRSLALSASLGLWWVQVAASFHESCRLRRNCRVLCLVGSSSMSSSRSTRWWTCFQEGTPSVRFARREKANGGSFTGGLPPRSALGAPPSGTCRVPRARRAPAPAASPGECWKRMSCHGHAHDRRGSPRTTPSPRRVRVCMLASRDLSSAQKTCRVCASDM